MRLKTLLAILLIGFFSANLHAEASQNRNTQSDLERDALITSLDPYVSKAIDDYYNSKGINNKQYGLYDTKILSIEREIEGGYIFRIKLQVLTYTGAHNPPFGIETITLRLNTGGAKVIDYQHQDKK